MPSHAVCRVCPHMDIKIYLHIYKIDRWIGRERERQINGFIVA